jgi:RND family efflux transporter MFP subunit
MKLNEETTAISAESAAEAGGALGAPTEAAGFSDAGAWSRLSEAPSTDAFAAAWLDLQCRLIGGVQAAVVVFGPGEDGGFAPLTYWPEGSRGNPALAAVAELSLEQRRGAVRQRQVSAEEGAVRLDALAYPLLVGDAARGVVAVELPHESDARMRTAMRLLQWGCAWWQAHLVRPGQSPADLTTVLDLLAAGLEEETFVAAATAVATDLATQLNCDRVSIGIRKGRHAQVRALSHTANFSKKSALIRALGTAMDEAIDQQTTVVVPQPDGAPPLITRAHEELTDKHGSKAVCTVPLSDSGRLCGALTLERDGERPFAASEVALCEHAGLLLGPVLEAKRREDRWIAVKVWESGVDFLGRLFGRGHLLLKAGTLALIALIVFFALATGEYRVTAPAVLEGTVQRAIIAPQDGYVAQADVRAGDLVEQDQVLAALEDKDLRLEKVQWEGEREKTLREYSRALAEGDRAQVRILGAQIEQAEARVALLAEQLARAQITAPFAGVVVSGDLSQSLGAPVSRGDVLFEIAPLHSYRVILNVDERDIGALQVDQTGQLALAGLPGEPLPIRVEKITPVASAEEGQNRFRVEAVLVEGKTAALRPGMNGIGKVSIDERNLFWIWTHKLGYWLKLWWWSWWP